MDHRGNLRHSFNSARIEFFFSVWVFLVRLSRIHRYVFHSAMQFIQSTDAPMFLSTLSYHHQVLMRQIGEHVKHTSCFGFIRNVGKLVSANRSKHNTQHIPIFRRSQHRSRNSLFAWHFPSGLASAPAQCIKSTIGSVVVLLSTSFANFHFCWESSPFAVCQCFVPYELLHHLTRANLFANDFQCSKCQRILYVCYLRTVES